MFYCPTQGNTVALPLPLPLSLFLPTPTRQLATPRCVCCCLSNFQLAAEYENFVWANLLYGILIVFAQLKLETETRLDSPRLAPTRGKHENSQRKTRNGKLRTAVVCWKFNELMNFQRTSQGDNGEGGGTTAAPEQVAWLRAYLLLDRHLPQLSINYERNWSALDMPVPLAVCLAVRLSACVCACVCVQI